MPIADAPAMPMLNDAFVRLYRSFLQYLREGWAVFDAHEVIFDHLIDGQRDDADQLAKLIFDEQGHVHSGSFPKEYAYMHYCSVTQLLPDIVGFQRTLIAELTNDRAKLGNAGAATTPGVKLLDDIIRRQKDALTQLESLLATHVA
jgi:hypothetical protein